MRQSLPSSVRINISRRPIYVGMPLSGIYCVDLIKKLQGPILMFKIAYGSSLVHDGELLMFKDDLNYMLSDIESLPESYAKALG